MSHKQPRELKERVEQAAGAVLSANGSVGPLELMLQIQWLAPSQLSSWRKGIIPSLEQLMQGSPEKREKAFRYFEQWAQRHGLKSVSVPYVRVTPGGEIQLQVMTEEDPAMERFFCTHYIPADLPAAKTERTVAKMSKPPDIVVFQTVRPSVPCTDCKTEIFTGNFLFMEKGAPLCMDCADLGHLEFLPSGNAALTRRARRYSRLSAVVVRFARARKRYERQGILVEPEAVQRAEAECLGDAEQRAVRRERETLRRAEQDEELVAAMVQSLQRMYPACPKKEAEKIAHHTAERGSGRVGRTTAGQNLEERALELAAAAWVRHHFTEYDDLLVQGCERLDARDIVQPKVHGILLRWKGE